MARRRAAARAATGQSAESDLDAESSPGVLMSSGLIAGGAIAGICLALLALVPATQQAIDLGARGLQLGDLGSILVFLALVLALARTARG